MSWYIVVGIIVVLGMILYLALGKKKTISTNTEEGGQISGEDVSSTDTQTEETQSNQEGEESENNSLNQ